MTSVCERPPDYDRRRQWSSLILPNGSVVCVSHMAPTELALSLTLAVYAEWDESPL